MSRIIHTKSPGQIRNQHRRTIAEALRRLSQKSQIDKDAKNLASLIVFCLHGMADTVDRTIQAWEKRNYWMKAERFREEWRWVDPAADEVGAVIYEDQWDQLPLVLAGLMPHFADITVKRMTRKPEIWRGAYEKFMQEG